MYLFNTVAKLTKNNKYINKLSTGVDISQQHSSNDFMNYFTSKIDTIRDQIVTILPSATVSHQIVHCKSHEEQFHSSSTIGEEELHKLVKSAKPTTCMLDPISSNLLKEVLPGVIDPLLSIINLSMSLGYVPKTFKLAVIKPLIKKTQLDSKYLVNYREGLGIVWGFFDTSAKSILLKWYRCLNGAWTDTCIYFFSINNWIGH